MKLVNRILPIYPSNHTALLALVGWMIVIFLLSASPSTFARNCAASSDQNLYLNNQRDVDGIGVSRCTRVTGDLVIRGSSATSLDPLTPIRQIDGSLIIENSGSLTNIDGLINLESIGGNLIINANRSLIDIIGLQSVSSIGGMLRIDNTLLRNVDGLARLTFVGDDVLIISNGLLENIDGLIGLGVTNSIYGSVVIQGNAALQNLEGLGNVRYIGEDLRIVANPTITNLDPLRKLVRVYRDLEIANNQSLSKCDVLAGILDWPNGDSYRDKVGRYRYIYNNAYSCSSISRLFATVVAPSTPNITQFSADTKSLSLRFDDAASSFSPSYTVTCTGAKLAADTAPYLDVLDDRPAAESRLSLSGYYPSEVPAQLQLSVNIEHSDPTDVRIVLRSPVGREVTVWNQSAAGGANIQTTFPRTDVYDGLGPSLGGLGYGPIDGDWVLSVQDVNTGPIPREGVLREWGIKATEIVTAESTSAPVKVSGLTYNREYSCSVISSSPAGTLSSDYATKILVSPCSDYGEAGKYIQRIFIAYLGRPAAPGALAYYADLFSRDIEGGKRILFDDLYKSAEAGVLYGGYSLQTQINQFYYFMFGRTAKAEGVDYWVDQIERGAFTIPAAAAYIANSASGPDMLVFNAKQVAASKTTCALDTEWETSNYQFSLNEARNLLEAVNTGSDAAAFSPLSLSSVDSGEAWLPSGTDAGSGDDMATGSDGNGSSDGDVSGGTGSTDSTGSPIFSPAPGDTDGAAALTPEFEGTTSTEDGFITLIGNYDAAFTYSVSASAGSVSLSEEKIIVTGLSPGSTSTVSVITSREGYDTGEASITANAISSGQPGAILSSEQYCQGSATIEYTATGFSPAPVEYYELNDAELRTCDPDINFDPLYIGRPYEDAVITQRKTLSYPFTLPARSQAKGVAYGYLRFVSTEPARSGESDDYFHAWVSEVPNGPVLDGFEDCELYQEQADGYMYYTQDTSQRRMCYLGTESRVLYMNFETRCLPGIFPGVCDEMNKRKSNRTYRFRVSRGYKE